MRDDRPCERRKTFSSFDHEPFHSGSTSGTIQETQEEEEDDLFQEITSTKVEIWNLFFLRDGQNFKIFDFPGFQNFGLCFVRCSIRMRIFFERYILIFWGELSVLQRLIRTEQKRSLSENEIYFSYQIYSVIRGRKLQ